jgi:hypothetical protein
VLRKGSGGVQQLGPDGKPKKGRPAKVVADGPKVLASPNSSKEAGMVMGERHGGHGHKDGRHKGAAGILTGSMTATSLASEGRDGERDREHGGQRSQQQHDVDIMSMSFLTGSNQVCACREFACVVIYACYVCMPVLAGCPPRCSTAMQSHPIPETLISIH